jgi:hypothetical protein
MLVVVGRGVTLRYGIGQCGAVRNGRINCLGCKTRWHNALELGWIPFLEDKRAESS